MTLSAFPVLSFLAASLVSYGFGVVLYRLTLHPLAKYPGPFLAKITSWYDTYHAWKEDRHLDQTKCHDIYGPIVRYAPNYVILNSAEALKEIYAGSKNTNVAKAKNYEFLHDKGATSTHSVIDKTIHGRKRRVLSHAFSDSALRSLETYMIQNVDSWLGILGDSQTAEKTQWSSPKNVAELANYLTFDVLGDLCFGKPFGLLQGLNRFVPPLMMSRLKTFHVVGHSPLLPLWPLIQRLRIDALIAPKLQKDTEQFRQFSGAAMNARVAQSDAEKFQPENDVSIRKDFFYWLTRAKDPQTGEGYTMPEMWAESRLLITAGSDTSSITIAAAFFYLLRNPSALEAVQSELRGSFSSVDEIVSGPQLNACHYLRAVIDETLRLAPPVPSSLARQVLAGGMSIGDDYFPEGTLVGTSSYAIHHSEKYYPDRWAFKPDRWIAPKSEDSAEAESLRLAKSAFCPFSLGSRGCIGKPMAYAELSIALGKVFYMYDVRLASGDVTGAGTRGAVEEGRRREGEFQLRDLFVSGRDGPVVQFKLHA